MNERKVWLCQVSMSAHAVMNYKTAYHDYWHTETFSSPFRMNDSQNRSA